MTENTGPKDLNGETSLNTPKEGESTMSSGEKEQGRISRREFVKGAAVGAAGVAAAGVLASCAQEATPCPTPEVIKETVKVPVEVIKEVEVKPWLPEKWDYEAEVVVVGFGLAGGVAATEAHDLGANVLVLEKAPQALAGGQSRASGQGLNSFDYKNMDGMMEYYHHLNDANPIPEDVLRTYLEGVVEKDEWINSKIKEVGFEYIANNSPHCEFPEFPHPDFYLSSIWDMEYYDPSVVGLSGWFSGDYFIRAPWKAFHKCAEKREIRVLWETSAKELIQDAVTKEVLGVVAEESGKKVYIKAKKAVALCCGGFEENEQMLKDFYGTRTVYNMGSPFNTGDGIKMLLKVGADLWHMRGLANPGGFFLGIKVPGYQPFFSGAGYGGRPTANYIEIAKDGRRFHDETYPYGRYHVKKKIHGEWMDAPYPECLPVHLIFDETFRKAGRIIAYRWGWCFVVEEYHWSEDNSEEIKKGWITKADTIRELATKVERDPDVLEEEVNKYNEYARTGEDLDYGRPADNIAPIETPPYYAVNLWPCLVATTGGGRRNKNAQVLDTDGKPIPRLYEAGELGSIHPYLYQNGSFLGECVVFGRIAAQNAVAEEPWG